MYDNKVDWKNGRKKNIRINFNDDSRSVYHPYGSLHRSFYRPQTNAIRIQDCATWTYIAIGRKDRSIMLLPLLRNVQYTAAI